MDDEKNEKRPSIISVVKEVDKYFFQYVVAFSGDFSTNFSSNCVK